jgi:hypothetical protein
MRQGLQRRKRLSDHGCGAPYHLYWNLCTEILSALVCSSMRSIPTSSGTATPIDGKLHALQVSQAFSRASDVNSGQRRSRPSRTFPFSCQRASVTQKNASTRRPPGTEIRHVSLVVHDRLYRLRHHEPRPSPADHDLKLRNSLLN